MARLFDEHVKREVKSLNGAWNFKADPTRTGEADEWQSGLTNVKSVIIPSVWNNILGMLEYEGVCWYEKKFFFNGGTLRLNFGAVMTYAKVYLDGEYLGEHYGGFCRFDFIKESVAEGMHTLTVRVDNSFDENSIPQATVDWYHYGGITRDVEAQKLSGICVLNNRFDYKISGDNADCKFTVELFNAENTEITDTLKIFVGDNAVIEKTVTLEPYEKATIVTDEFSVNAIRLWSPETPALYDVQLATSTDDLFDRVGFRTVEVKDAKIYLNGKRIKFCGINRHEEHPDFGMAFPKALMQRDVDIIRGANCNSIRGSHYPNNPTFLDILDERGMMFFSEIPIWGGGFSKEALGSPAVVERGLMMHKEMVREYYNHPSIVIWGMHNEIDTTLPEAYEMTRKYYEFLKSNGGNRLVTFATDHPIDDICLEFCDVICINMYCGWYKTEMDYWPTFLADFEAKRKRLGYTEKPVIMSEFGAAAIYGHHTFDDLRWTEEYQARLLSYCIELFFSRDEYAGTFIWQYCDIRTAKEMGLNRARSFNNKGIVNEYRRPKLAYGAVRDTYKGLKEKM